MDAKRSKDRFKFPLDVGSNAAGRQLYMDLSGSLVHKDVYFHNNDPNKQQNTATFTLLWRAFQKPIGKIGTMILFLSWLILAMATSASVLSWVGTIGAVSGATLIGLSLFSSYSGNVRTNNVQTEELAYEHSGAKKS